MTTTMATTRFQKANCDLCGCYTWKDSLEMREEGLACYACVKLPPYSDELYRGLVNLQRLFRKHFEEAAKPCHNCEKKTLTLHEFQDGLICEECEHELNPPPETCDDCGYEHCHCDENGGPCEECGNPHECVCAEHQEDARLVRHRRICGFADCEGDCGTLDCGCIDKCKCDDDDEREEQDYDW